MINISNLCLSLCVSQMVFPWEKYSFTNTNFPSTSPWMKDL